MMLAAASSPMWWSVANRAPRTIAAARAAARALAVRRSASSRSAGATVDSVDDRFTLSRPWRLSAWRRSQIVLWRSATDEHIGEESAMAAEIPSFEEPPGCRFGKDIDREFVGERGPLCPVH